MAEQKPSRGVQGVLVKLWRGGEYVLTVTGRTELSPHYLRLHFDSGSLLSERPIHPTMWVRGWFPDGDKAHQRGYTLVNPDPATRTLDIDFAMHDGVATRWARDAAAGDVLEVTVLGSNFTLPTPSPAGYVIVGDTASLPAINSLLAAIDDAPAQVLLGGLTVGLTGRGNDRHQEFLDHRAFVVGVAAREDQQRGQHAYQPPGLADDGLRVVGCAQRYDECRAHRLDHIGLLGDLDADGGVARGEPRLQCRAVAHNTEGRQKARDETLARVVDPAESLDHLAVHRMGLAVDEGGVQSLSILEVSVERGARTPGGFGDFVHADRGRRLLGEQIARGVEDALGRHLVAFGR
jgi:NADPH-dependent ferric siderophore reductase